MLLYGGPRLQDIISATAVITLQVVRCTQLGYKGRWEKVKTKSGKKLEESCKPCNNEILARLKLRECKQKSSFNDFYTEEKLLARLKNSIPTNLINKYRYAMQSSSAVTVTRLCIENGDNVTKEEDTTFAQTQESRQATAWHEHATTADGRIQTGKTDWENQQRDHRIQWLDQHSTYMYILRIASAVGTTTIQVAPTVLPKMCSKHGKGLRQNRSLCQIVSKQDSISFPKTIAHNTSRPQGNRVGKNWHSHTGKSRYFPGWEIICFQSMWEIVGNNNFQNLSMFPQKDHKRPTSVS